MLHQNVVSKTLIGIKLGICQTKKNKAFCFCTLISSLFSLSIKTLPFGSGLNEEDHPFYYVKANEEQLAENMMMSVIGEALESEEESRQISKIFSEQKTGGKAIMTDNTKKGSEKYAQSIFKNETKALGNGEEFFYGNADGKADKSDEEKESDFDKSENEVNR